MNRTQLQNYLDGKDIGYVYAVVTPRDGVHVVIEASSNTVVAAIIPAQRVCFWADRWPITTRKICDQFNLKPTRASEDDLSSARRGDITPLLARILVGES